DGSGANPPALYAFGAPRFNGVLFRGVLKWDGSQGTTLPFPMNWSFDYSTSLSALIAFDEDGDGPAPALPPGGGVARWTGATWEIVGGGLGRAGAPWPASYIYPLPENLAIFDEDGDGPTRQRCSFAERFTGRGTIRRSSASQNGTVRPGRPSEMYPGETRGR